MQKLISFFKNPFPYPTTKRAKFLISLYCSLLTFLMILLFKPGQREPLPFIENIPFAFVYSILAFFVLFLSQLFLQRFFIRDKVNYFNLVIWLIFNSFLIAHGNYVIGYIIFHNPLKIQYYLELVFGTISTASIIFFIVILVYQYFNLKKCIDEQNLLVFESDKGQQITLQADNPDNNVNIESAQLVYIDAMENYIVIHYLNNNDLLSSKILRTTMKKTEKALKQNSEFIRCHRSYMVNKNYVARINKIGQCFELILKVNNIAIPVSRKLNNQIKFIFFKIFNK